MFRLDDTFEHLVGTPLIRFPDLIGHVPVAEGVSISRSNQGSIGHRFQTCYRWEDSYSDWELEFGQFSSCHRMRVLQRIYVHVFR